MTTCNACGQTSLLSFESHPDYCPRCVGAMREAEAEREAERRKNKIWDGIMYLLTTDPGVGDVCRDLRERNPDDGRAPRQRKMRFV